MPATRHAIFHTDASVAIGGGHVRRCLVLADALAEAGWGITFVCSAEASDIVPMLRQRPYTLIEPTAFDAVIRELGFSCALLVVDDYRLDAAFESACRSWAERILVIDDLANRRHDCDLLLDQSPGRRHADYADFVPHDAELLLGPAYALLDPRFRAARRGQRKEAGKIARIFVNFGTVDTANATQVALDALAEAKLGAVVDIVLGSAAPHLDAIRARMASSGIAATLHLDVDDVASLMRRADLAIGAGGVGALERCALGLPSVILIVADNQTANATALGASGAAVYFGNIADRSAKEVARALRDLSSNEAARRAMSAAASALVDGFGAPRVRASSYSPLRAKDGRRVTLRPATLADAAMMLAWQTAPGIRAFARNPAAPQQGEHEPWLRRKLADPDCLFNIVLCGDEPAGILRFDRIAARDAFEVSILVAPDRHRLGIGGCALELGKRLLPAERIIAAIHPGNAASIRMFEHAGYRQAKADEWLLEPATAASGRA